ncbi:hypothetical protein [Nonomuraea rhodomycinica]|uniref:Uncharacterized protein n=1 Tax=Nonomuraea rhodomycinica TaxID=1712872 RepID=A0A7Y6IK12_9ACTN|nr:hypothetical protein [Nonomuraea rhodomycinica]NUW39553.1 hypothetical protein [Nonomuraea rhodomycinica]
MVFEASVGCRRPAAGPGRTGQGLGEVPDLPDGEGAVEEEGVSASPAHLTPPTTSADDWPPDGTGPFAYGPTPASARPNRQCGTERWSLPFAQVPTALTAFIAGGEGPRTLLGSLLIPGIVGIITVAVIAEALPLTARALLVPVTAIVAGLAAFTMLGPGLNILSGGSWQVAGLSMLYLVAIIGAGLGLVCALLPPNAFMAAGRSVLYFDGAGVTQPIAVLLAWAVGGYLLIVFGRVRQGWR